MFGDEKKRLQAELDKTKTDVEELNVKLSQIRSENYNLQEHVKFLVEQSRNIERTSSHFASFHLTMYPYELGEFLRIKTEFLEKLKYKKDNATDASASDRENRNLSSAFASQIDKKIRSDALTLNHIAPMMTDIIKEIDNYSSALAVTSSKRHDIIEKYAQVLVAENPQVSQELRNILVLNTSAHARINANLDIIKLTLSKTSFFKNKEFNQLEETFKYMRKEVQAEADQMIKELYNSDNAIGKSSLSRYFTTLSTLTSDVLTIYNGLPKDVEKVITDVSHIRDLELDIISRIKSNDKINKKIETIKIDIRNDMVAYYKALRKLAVTCESCRAFFNSQIVSSSDYMKPFVDFEHKEIWNYADKFDRDRDISILLRGKRISDATIPFDKAIKDNVSCANIRYDIIKKIEELKKELSASSNSDQLSELQKLVPVEQNFDSHSRSTVFHIEEVNAFGRGSELKLSWLILIGSKFEHGSTRENEKRFSIFDVPENVEEYVKTVIGL